MEITTLESAASWRSLLKGGEIDTEAPVQTTEGVRVAGCGMGESRERWHPQRRAVSFMLAPEICGEILSPSNCREEMLEKMTLYYAKGAQEVWLCDIDGRVEFFTASSAPQSVPASFHCPEFPGKMDVD